MHRRPCSTTRLADNEPTVKSHLHRRYVDDASCIGRTLAQASYGGPLLPLGSTDLDAQCVTVIWNNRESERDRQSGLTTLRVPADHILRSFSLAGPSAAIPSSVRSPPP